MNVCLVHDYLNQHGGAERVLEAFKELYPDAPIYTLLISEENRKRYDSWDIRTSFIQKLPFARRHYEKYFPFFPVAVESFDLRDYDLVLSSSSAWAKGALTLPETTHICYCHSPMRFAWDWYHSRLNEERRILKPFLSAALNRVRVWDVASSSRVDHYIANSTLVQRRIQKYYRRNADVIFPPVDVERFGRLAEQNRKEYYVVLSRLKPYKRIDLAVQACTELGRKLYVIGEGSQYKSLKRMAGDSVKFTGRLDDQEVGDKLSRASALLFPGLEDFGIVPLEAVSCGTPVIAFGSGGVCDSMIPFDESATDNSDRSPTAVFFDEQTAQSLKEAILCFEKNRDAFRTADMKRHAAGFSTSGFIRSVRKYIQNTLQP